MFDENIMFHAYTLIYKVHQKFRGLPERLARITAKSDDLFRSHGYQSKTDNPLACGNPSPVTHYVTYARQYQAAMPGAGRMLNNLVHEALDSEFAESDIGNTTQSDLNVSVLTGTCGVEKWLARFDIEKASRNELLGFESECDEAVDAILAAKARARVVRRKRELKQVA